MTSKLLVVTVNYACAEAILEGMDQTVAQLRAFDGGARFWIVDNQSPDSSAIMLREAIAARGWGDVVDVIDAKCNSGFGAGNNLAVRRAMAEDSPPDYIYFLNPDAIPAPGSILAMTSFLDATPAAGVVGGLLEGEDGELQVRCSGFHHF
ncbi:glycosyltransferase [Loktanella sp. DJP18]|uniref:glycosyltransferase n=1 Tax=Loktanella sp. DJP18 TaxID=3409788 RepID=UPI003BB6EE42